MNEEIKEILDYLKDENEYYDEEEQVIVNDGELIVEKEDIDKLLNYITNLQEENEKLKETIKEAKEKSIKLQEKYDYILDDLTFILARGIDYE